MKIIAFAASNSRQSINKKLVTHAAGLIEGAEVEVLDLNDFAAPIYSQDHEAEHGHPQQAKNFLEKINGADAILISFAEHNGSYTAAYKSLFDWSSRIQQKVFNEKPVIALSTSPGPGGAKSVLQAATTSLPYFGATVKASLSIPSFHSNFDAATGELSNPELKQQLQAALATLKA
ncbi:NADPH-dependent FMN reductase [Undibacterium sp. Dicai25W]|uniref:NADPH-dependent FMN reductase n=1 Tax=Undibacterium sp. Dicai25W TaxID=3413034 RepID=UPI003BF45612